MKKWLVAFTAGAVVIGCGGGSGLDGLTGGNTGGGGGTGRTVPAPNLGSKAQVQVLYLSGQGRRAVGSQVAVMNNIRVFNSPTDFMPSDHQGSGSPIRVQLDGYTLNQFVFDVPLTTGGQSKTFNQFPLEIAQIDEVGVGTVFSGPPFLVSPFFPINLQLFPGRQTTLQVVLNDAMLSFDSQTGVSFDRQQFEIENLSPTNNKINGFLSDMFAFDVSGLPAVQRPLLTNGNRADTVHFSGDSIGISAGFDAVGSFEMLSPIVIDQGVLKKETVVGGRKAPGIYTVMEPDPRDPFGDAKVVAIQGIHRPYTDVLTNLSDFGMVAIPTTRSSSTYQVVMFNRDSAGTITAMWQGVLLTTSATKGVLRLFSLDQLPDASAAPRATGEVNFTMSNGMVKTGTFSVTSRPSSFPFPATGGFAVLR